MIVNHPLHSGDSMVRSLGMCTEVIRVTGDGIRRSLGSLVMVWGGLWGCVEVIWVTGDDMGRSLGMCMEVIRITGDGMGRGLGGQPLLPFPMICSPPPENKYTLVTGIEALRRCAVLKRFERLHVFSGRQIENVF